MRIHVQHEHGHQCFGVEVLLVWVVSLKLQTLHCEFKVGRSSGRALVWSEGRGNYVSNSEQEGWWLNLVLEQGDP